MWDVCWCCEFVEHVDAMHARNFIKLMACCKTVAMTHAVPDQGGHHHVNERLPNYWVRRLMKYGLKLDLGLTKSLRQLARDLGRPDHGLYIRRILLVFKNTDKGESHGE